MAADDAPEPEKARPLGPRPGGERASRSDYLGCGVWVLGFVVLVCVSFAVGVVLRPDADPKVDLARVGPADGDYRLVASIDEANDPCVTLFDGDDEVTGQCGIALGTAEVDDTGRYAFTSAELSDGTTVAFGPVPRAAETVVVELADGSTERAQVHADDGLDEDVFWFSLESDEAIAEGSTATLLDLNGNPVTTG